MKSKSKFNLLMSCLVFLVTTVSSENLANEVGRYASLAMGIGGAIGMGIGFFGLLVSADSSYSPSYTPPNMAMIIKTYSGANGH
jgi:hypothetical protein